jgi:SecD/SecF fusion protein
VGKERKTIDFLSKRGFFFAVSIAVIVTGFAFMGVHKAKGENTLNYSLEFVGGASTSVTFPKDMSIADLDTAVVPMIEAITGDGNVMSQKVQGTNEVIFKTRTLTVDERDAMKNVLVENFDVDAETITVENISSTISNEMKKDTLIAVSIAVLLMLLYIRIRFSDIRFGISSVVALLHDVLVVLAFYAVARVTVSNTFIACMLTIVGYSINATIVIFDRIRENMVTMTRKETLKDVVNKSITQTLSRSIFTSLTTFIMVAALYVLGVTSIREFALPLMVGIVCGTYSSICLAGGLWYVLREKFPPKPSED